MAMPNRFRLITFTVLLLLLVLAFGNCIRNDFTFDSVPIIRDDARVRTLNLKTLKLVFSEHYWRASTASDLYRPITTFSYQLNWLLTNSPKNPTSFHLINLLLHYANALLIVGIFWRLLGCWASLFVASVFLVHPLNVESVTNLVGRADLLATLAILVGLAAHIRWVEHGNARWLVLLGGVGFVGVFCKETAIMLFGVLAAWDFSFNRNQPKRRLCFSYIVLIPSWIAMFLSRHFVLGNSPVFVQSAVDNPLVLAAPITRVLTALSIQGQYIGLFFWPSQLSCDYSYNQISFFGESWTATAWIVVLGSSIGTIVWLGRHHRSVIFFALTIFAVMLPTSNLLFQIGTIMGDRFMYLPTACLAAITVIGIKSLVRKSLIPSIKYLLFVIAMVTLLILSARTWVRNRDWKDDVSLWTAAAQTCPKSFKCYQSLAQSLRDRDGVEKTADKMIELLNQSRYILETSKLPVVDRALHTYNLLTLGYWQQADAQALVEIQTGVSSNTLSQQKYQKALETCQLGVEVDQAINQASRQSRIKKGIPEKDVFDVGNYQIHYLHAMLLERTGNASKALEAIEYARHLTPNNPDLHLAAAEMNLRHNQLPLAAIRGWQALLTGKDSVWPMLEQIYKQIAPNDQLVTLSNAGPSVHLQHPMITGHLDDALQELTVACHRVELDRVARDMLKMANRDLLRPIDHLEQYLARP